MEFSRRGYREWQRQSGSTVFFPAAALYATLGLPASILAMTGDIVAPGLAGAANHAHEMLFGFALAVVAGNQLGPTRLPYLFMLLVLWIAARAAYIAAPASVPSAIANCAFPLALALPLLPKRLKAVKKPRNFALPVPFAAICLLACAMELSALFGMANLLRPLFEVAVLLFSLLMLFMGGRLIAPAIAGQFYRQGEVLDARVQPRLEGTSIAAMAFAILASAFLKPVAAFACELAGVLVTIRIFRWRPWALHTRPDLLCLVVGYGWLGLGLFVLGVAWHAGFHATAAMHVITIGALGTLTLNVMAFSWTARAGGEPGHEHISSWSTALLAAALFARIAADFSAFGETRAWLLAAAILWCAAFALLQVLFVRRRSARRVRESS